MKSVKLKGMERALKDAGLLVPFTVIERPIDETIVVMISGDDVEAKVRSRKTSTRQLDNIIKKVSTIFGKRFEYIISKGEIQEKHESSIEEALERTLNVSSTCTVKSSGENTVDVLVGLESTKDNAEDLIVNAEELIRDYFSIYKITPIISIDVNIVGASPSLVNILSLVKIRAPIRVDQMDFDGDFHVPSIKWLTKELDKLRKHGLLIRQKDGGYVLTELGLKVAPHGTTRASSDIARALFLSRRRW